MSDRGIDRKGTEEPHVGERATGAPIAAPKGVPAPRPKPANAPSKVPVWFSDVAARIDARNRGAIRRLPLLGSIIHTTRGRDVQGALNKVQTENESWHFTIGRDGMIFQHVAMDRIAGHAGYAELQSDGQTIRTLNEQMIGIELVNLGGLLWLPVTGGRKQYHYWIPAKKEGEKPKIGGPVAPPTQLTQLNTLAVDGTEHPAWWEPFPDAQISGLNRLIATFHYTGWSKAAKVIGHEAVAVNPRGRKIDPGPLFPWEKLNFDKGVL